MISSDAAECATARPCAFWGRYLQAILRMQTKREKAILRTLQASPGTAGDLCNEIYGSTTAALPLGFLLRPAILRMAQELVEQHLEEWHLEGVAFNARRTFKSAAASLAALISLEGAGAP